MKTITDYSLLCSEVRSYFSTNKKCAKPLLLWFGRSAGLSNVQLDKFKKDIRKNVDWGIEDDRVFHRYINQMEEAFLKDILDSFRNQYKPTLLLANTYEYDKKPCWVDEVFDQICFDPILTVALVSCSKKKNQIQGKFHASELYTSSLFKKAWAYGARVEYDARFILSDKYGLLDGDSLVGSYDESLKDKTPQERQKWAKEVCDALSLKGFDLSRDCFVLFAGKIYCKTLIDSQLVTNTCKIYAKNNLRGIGHIMHFLSI